MLSVWLRLHAERVIFNFTSKHISFQLLPELEPYLKSWLRLPPMTQMPFHPCRM